MTYTAFMNTKIIAEGALPDVAVKVKTQSEKHPQAEILVFDDRTGRVRDLDLRGNAEAVRTHNVDPVEAEPGETRAGPGRPKLGVVSREISLLPRHWEWLARQPGGASVTLRKLVDDAKKNSSRRDLMREAQEVAYRFMSTIAGNLPNYEEALRALYAGKEKSFKELTADWPKDIRRHCEKLAEKAFN